MSLGRFVVSSMVWGSVCLCLVGCPSGSNETAADRADAVAESSGLDGEMTPAAKGAATPVEPCVDVAWLDDPVFLYDVPQASQTGACQFHQFSWQNFVHLVAPGGGPRFEQMSPIQAVFRDQGPALCSDVHLLGSQLTVVTKNDQQASGDPLIDQNGRSVHFSIRVNETECAYINEHRLYDSACYNEAVAQRLTLPAGSEDTVGALEIKVAWRTMETCDLPDSPPPGTCRKDDLSRYLTVPGVVQPLNPDHRAPVSVTLGLVGFHLIQKTPDHPEFIWASFEHVDNDPVCAGAENTLCQAPDVVPTGGWSFNNPDCEDCPVNTHTPDHDSDPAQVCRAHPCGVDWSNEDNAKVNAEAIRQLNDAVHEVLEPQDAVLANYRLIGTLWTKKNTSIPEQPPFDFKDIQTGSTLLANTTLETFNQEINCFVCHNNSAVAYTPPDAGQSASAQLNFSFVFSRIQQQTDACDVR